MDHGGRQPPTPRERSTVDVGSGHGTRHMGTWGVAVQEGDLYELIAPTYEEEELDLESSAP